MLPTNGFRGRRSEAPNIGSAETGTVSGGFASARSGYLCSSRIYFARALRHRCDLSVGRQSEGVIGRHRCLCGGYVDAFPCKGAKPYAPDRLTCLSAHIVVSGGRCTKQMARYCWMVMASCWCLCTVPRVFALTVVIRTPNTTVAGLVLAIVAMALQVFLCCLGVIGVVLEYVHTASRVHMPWIDLFNHVPLTQ
eukprot:scaffold926_cov408-Prasinococcus_capsulatus_cf.AAC.39